MIFHKMVHWSDGLFLQPHHMQQLQRSIIGMQEKSVELLSYYPYGLIDFVVNKEALDGMRFVVKRLSAIMPNNLMVSMPGNINITPFTINASEYVGSDYIMIYLAIPNYKESDSNLSQYENERMFNTKEVLIRNENTGDNEISMLKRMYNGKITTSTKNEDYVYLPIARLVWISRNINNPKLEIDTSYIPPFYIISNDCPLKSNISELMYVIKKKCAHIIKDLSDSKYNTKNLEGTNLFNVMQLSSLSSYEKVISALISTGKASPFEIYVQLTSLLSELTALQPFTNRNSVLPYSHENLTEVFHDVSTNIRSMLLAGGYTDYVQYDFISDGDFYKTRLSNTDIVRAIDCYLAVSTSGNRDIAREQIEQGDNFKLLSERSVAQRIRGVKLRELRFPPRYLPVIPNAIWFSLNDMSENETWSLICKEKVAAIELLPEYFPDFQGYLFMIFEGGKDDAV